MTKALDYLKSLQWSDKISGVSPEMRLKSDQDIKYGGFGYGRRARPDLSNTQMALDALHDAGLKSDDPAFQAATKFVAHCQNFPRPMTSPGPAMMGDLSIPPRMAVIQPRGNSPALGAGACCVVMDR